MKTIFIIGILLSIAILGLILPNKIQGYMLSKSRETATVQVLQVPDCSFSYKHKFIHIRYNDKKYILRTKCKYVDSLVVGQELIMLHKKGSSLFLFLNEDVFSELITTILLSFSILACLGGIWWRQTK